MHSKIFQISKTPITDNKRLTLDMFDDYNSNFIPAIGDYVDTLEDEAGEIDWLFEQTFANSVKRTKGNKFRIVNKNEYFRDKFENFKTNMEVIKDMTLDQFSSHDCEFTKARKYDNQPYRTNIDSIMYSLGADFDDKFGFYVDDRKTDYYYGLITMDSFMRSVNNGDKFYLGAVIDYHF